MQIKTFHLRRHADVIWTWWKWQVIEDHQFRKGIFIPVIRLDFAKKTAFFVYVPLIFHRYTDHINVAPFTALTRKSRKEKHEFVFLLKHFYVLFANSPSLPVCKPWKYIRYTITCICIALRKYFLLTMTVNYEYFSFFHSDSEKKYLYRSILFPLSLDSTSFMCLEKNEGKKRLQKIYSMIFLFFFFLLIFFSYDLMMYTHISTFGVMIMNYD